MICCRYLRIFRGASTAAQEGSPPYVARAMGPAIAGGGIFRDASTAAREGSPPYVARAVRPAIAGGGIFRGASSAAREGSPPYVARAMRLVTAGGGIFRNPGTTNREEVAGAIRLVNGRLATFGGLPSWATVFAILEQFRFSPMEIR